MKQSRPRMTSGTSARSPGSQARSATPASASRVWQASRSGPPPTIARRNRPRSAGCRASARTKARASSVWFLTVCIRPTVPTTNRAGSVNGLPASGARPPAAT